MPRTLRAVVACIEHYQAKFAAVDYWMKRACSDATDKELVELEQRYFSSISELSDAFKEKLAENGVVLEKQQIDTLLLSPTSVATATSDELVACEKELNAINDSIERQLAESIPRHDVKMFKTRIEATRSKEKSPEVTHKTPGV